MNILNKYLKPIQETNIAKFLKSNNFHKKISFLWKLNFIITTSIYKKININILIYQILTNKNITIETKKIHISSLINLFNFIHRGQLENNQNNSETNLIDLIVEKVITDEFHSIGIDSIKMYKDILYFLGSLGFKPKNITSPIYYHNEAISVASFEVFFGYNLIKNVNLSTSLQEKLPLWCTPIAKTCLAGFPILFELFIKNGANVNSFSVYSNANNNYIKSIYEDKIKPISNIFTLFEYICYTNRKENFNLDSLKILLQYFNPFEKKDHNGNNYLHNMIFYGQIKSIKKLFYNKFIKLEHINHPNKINQTPIQMIDIILSKDYCSKDEKDELLELVSLLESILLKEYTNTYNCKKITKI